MNDEALTKVISEFGPVVAKEVVEGEQPQTEGMSAEDWDNVDWRIPIGAIQDLATLRRVRRTYASALGLLAELRRGESTASITVIQQHISEIADGIWFWPQQWETERQCRASHNSTPVAWHYNANRRDYILLLKSHAFHTEPPRVGSLAEQDLDDPIGTLARRAAWSAIVTKPYRAGHLVLCELINVFDTEVRYFGDRAVEALPFGSLRFGIRPSLNLILRHLYLGRAGAQVCGNDRCRCFFESKREGQIYCSDQCSQRYRQRQYWAKEGAGRRQSRCAKRRRSQRKGKRVR